MLGFDCDGVLGNFALQYMRYYQMVYPFRPAYDFIHADNYNFQKIGGELWKLDGYYSDMAVMDGAQRTIEMCFEKQIPICVITATPDYAMPARTHWLNCMFPQIATEQIFFVSASEKLQFCKEHGIHVLIEDCPDTVESFSPDQVLLFDWSYNRHLAGRYQSVTHQSLQELLNSPEFVERCKR